MKTYKIEIKLNKEQEQVYKLNVSACRFIYNLYIQKNEEAYKNREKFIGAYTFSKWFNNEYITHNLDKLWLKQASSKAIQRTMVNCESAYRKFFGNVNHKPKFKKASTDKTGYYFVRTRKNILIKHQRNKIKIPCMGWVTFKEMNYLPKSSVIVSGVIIKRADRFFVVLSTEDVTKKDNKNQNEGIGIDLGIKTFMTCSNGFSFNNINKSKQVKKLEKSIKRQQRALSRKYMIHKINKEMTWSNYNKNKLKIEKLHYRLQCIRHGYINKCIDKIIDEKPNYIVLEHLNLQGMRKNKHIARALCNANFYYTKQKIIEKATKHNIEIREVNKVYPSSKTCCKCGSIKKDLTLKDRIYKCSNCNNEIDRDLNASINLKNAEEYTILNETTGGLPESNAYGLHSNLLVVRNNESMQDEIRKSIKVIDNINFSWNNIDDRLLNEEMDVII